MSAYFRKSIKIAPGVHLNMSKRGTGVSFGGRGAHVSFSPTGRVTKTVSIPGTGITPCWLRIFGTLAQGFTPHGQGK